MFVGDSMSLNQWQSLTCMLHAWVPNSKTTVTRKDGLSSVTFEEYGVTILLYRTPFLVDLVKDNGGTILKLDSIYSGRAWVGMDMLIFNTWHWWTHTGRTQPWKYMQEGNKKYTDMNRLVAFYKGLTTWARWVNLYVDPSKTKVFFQGISPTHYEGKDWNQPTKSCPEETQPFFGTRYPSGKPLAWVVVNKGNIQGSVWKGRKWVKRPTILFIFSSTFLPLANGAFRWVLILLKVQLCGNIEMASEKAGRENTTTEREVYLERDSVPKMTTHFQSLTTKDSDGGKETRQRTNRELGSERERSANTVGASDKAGEARETNEVGAQFESLADKGTDIDASRDND
ncbi:hypothetical protein GH714_011217 [Hevea brasiliensis]|uniref:Trichome birefringence-like C-terminal domain-containing protein n=1 Tax=Hevea brasiliensis TaxID=3981 RepID=A0A6A6K4Z9_HEVBR|nr:hypothetical protein GH714_011217 [Hevea brasiliensis]